MIIPQVNWSVINTALLVGAIGYLWRQAKTVDSVRQVLLGVEGQGGMLEETRTLRQRVELLETTMGVLNASVGHLTLALDNQLRQRTHRVEEQ